MAGETSETTTGQTTEATESAQQTATPAAAVNTDTAAREEMIPRNRFDELNKRFRDAEKQAKEFEKELANFRKTQDDAKAKDLAEQGRWKEIAEQNALKLANLEGMPDKLKEYEATITGLLEGQRDGLPAAIIELLDAMPAVKQLEWISKHKAELVKPANGQQQSKQQKPLADFNPSGTPGNAESDQQRVKRIQTARGQMASPFASPNK